MVFWGIWLNEIEMKNICLSPLASFNLLLYSSETVSSEEQEVCFSTIPTLQCRSMFHPLAMMTPRRNRRSLHPKYSFTLTLTTPTHVSYYPKFNGPFPSSETTNPDLYIRVLGLPDSSDSHSGIIRILRNTHTRNGCPNDFTRRLQIWMPFQRRQNPIV